MSTTTKSPAVPSSSGVGAALDVSDLAPLKSIVVTASGSGARSMVIVEGRHSASGSWGTLAVFDTRGTRTLIACVKEIRVRLKGYKRGTFTVDVAAAASGGVFVDLPVPSSDGTGTAVDVSNLGSLVTAIVGSSGADSFAGTIAVEFSHDGSDWGQIGQTFSGVGGLDSFEAPATWARVRRQGTRTSPAGTPVVSLGGGFDVRRRDTFEADEFILTSGPKLIGTSSDPSAGAGLAAPTGSLALQTDGTIWRKSGSADTAWESDTSNDPTYTTVTADEFITSDGPKIVGATSDPSAGAGLAAPEGSLALQDDGTLWRKTGSADTAWESSDAPTFDSVTFASLAAEPGDPSAGARAYYFDDGVNPAEFRVRWNDGNVPLRLRSQEAHVSGRLKFIGTAGGVATPDAYHNRDAGYGLYFAEDGSANPLVGLSANGADRLRVSNADVRIKNVALHPEAKVLFARGSGAAVAEDVNPDTVGLFMPAGTDVALRNGASSTLTVGQTLITLNASDGVRLVSGRLEHDGNEVGFYGVAPTTQPAALTAADSSAVNSGDATTDAVINNIRTRVNEIESKQQSLGLLA